LSPCENLSISEFEKSIVSIYPNPTNDMITINSTLPILKVEIFNMLGSMVGKTNSNNSVDLSLQPSGIYFLKIYSDSGFTSKKVIRN
jgi:hypothetical protein